MFKRVSRQFISALLLLNLLCQQFVPLAFLITPAMAVETATTLTTAPIVSLVDATFNVDVNGVTEVSYAITYDHQVEDAPVAEQLTGLVTADQGLAQIRAYAGTCSGADCTPHTGITRGQIEIQGTTTELRPVAATIAFEIHDNRLWQVNGDTYTIDQVSLGHVYQAPQQPDLKIVFTQLPTPAGAVHIKTINLSEEQRQAVGAVSPQAFEITSSMSDGSFAYDLQLPVPESYQHPEELVVKYAESVAELDQATTVDSAVTAAGETVEVTDLNHFTVFVVADPTSGTNDNSAGTSNWFTILPANQLSARIATSNDRYALVDVDGSTSNYLVASNLGLSIPSNAVITGITATIEKGSTSLNNGGTHDAVVSLMKNGVIAGDNKADLVTSYPVFSDTISSYGSPTDLWGTTWTPADVNAANFGLALAVSKPNAAGLPHVARVDHMQVQVAYVAIDLTSPVGGENYLVGSTQTITWTAPDTDALPNDSLIDLAYTTDGVTFVPIASGLANTGSYVWTVPSLSSQTVQVRATVTDGVNNTVSASDVSGQFTVGYVAPVLSFSGFRDQVSAVYNTSPVINPCGAVNTTGFIAWEWQVTNSPTNNPITYTYTIMSGPTAVGYTATTTNTHYNGSIPAQGTYVVRVVGRDSLNQLSNAITCEVTYDATPPAQPVFWVEEDTSSVDVIWQPAVDAVEYRIYRDGSLLTTVVGTTYSDGTAGTLSTHTYEVRAVDNHGLESLPQTAKQAQTMDVVIDDSATTSDVNASGTFAASVGWSAYDVTASPVLQNAVGGDNLSTVGASAGQTATWTTASTLDGLYEVYVQYICDSSRGNAQYTINSGSFVVGNRVVDQSTTDGTTQCGGQSAVSTAGANWVSLGQYPMVNAQGAVTVTAAAGEVNILADAVAFRYVGPYGSIQGRKYLDVNGNGNFDASEQSAPGNVNRLNGWSISLYSNLAAAPVATMVTGDDTTLAGVVGKGQYRFTGLAAGTYYVCETQQTGWSQTEASTGVANPNGDGTVCFTVALGSGQNVVGRQFGNFEFNHVSGQKFNDLNADGVKDAGEPGLANWTITLTGSNAQGAVNESQVTDGSGYYEFATVLPGTYIVCEQVQADWTQTFPVTGDCYDVVVTQSGQEFTDRDFGNAQQGMIQGRKFVDDNADHTRDAGEAFVNGWSIKLYQLVSGVWTSVTSMVTGDDTTPAGNVAQGQYRFTGLLTGEYAVCEDMSTQPAGWVQTRPYISLNSAVEQSVVDASLWTPVGLTNYCHTVRLAPNQDKVGVRFGNFKLAEIFGQKFSDANSNGARDKGEPGMNEWLITITGTDVYGNAVAKSTLTDIYGEYAFTGANGLLAGTYDVCEGAQANWTQTMPSGTGCYQVTVDQSGQIFTDVTFGNHYNAPGNGGGGSGSSNGGSGGSLPGAPVCSNQAPTSAPANLHIQSSGTNTVTLAWNAVSPVTHYALVFTRTSDGSQYGATNIGNVTSYTISGLSGSDSYTFEVLGVNGCQPGPRASTKSGLIAGAVLSSRPVGQDGTVLGTSTEVVELDEEATASAQALVPVQPSEVLGMATCANPWWRWWLLVVQAVVLAVMAVVTIKRSRLAWLIAAGVVSAVTVIIIWLFFCALLPWLYYALVVTLIMVVLRELFKPGSNDPELPTTGGEAKPKRRRATLRFLLA